MSVQVSRDYEKKVFKRGQLRDKTILESKEEVPEYLVCEQISSVWDKATKVLKEKLVPA